MVKMKTKTNKEALLQAAGMLRKLSKVNYYDTKFTDMLGNIRKADKIVGLLEKKGAIPMSFAQRRPITGIPVEESMKAASEFCYVGEPFIAISYSLSAAENAVMKAAKGKEFITDIYPLKAVFAGVKATILSAAEKLEQLSKPPEPSYRRILGY